MDAVLVQEFPRQFGAGLKVAQAGEFSGKGGCDGAFVVGGEGFFQCQSDHPDAPGGESVIILHAAIADVLPVQGRAQGLPAQGGGKSRKQVLQLALCLPHGAAEPGKPAAFHHLRDRILAILRHIRLRLQLRPGLADQDLRRNA